MTDCSRRRYSLSLIWRRSDSEKRLYYRWKYSFKQLFLVNRTCRFIRDLTQIKLLTTLMTEVCGWREFPTARTAKHFRKFVLIATLFNLQQLFFICSKVIKLQQLYFICSNFLICGMSVVGHRSSLRLLLVLWLVRAISLTLVFGQSFENRSMSWLIPQASYICCVCRLL